MTVTWYNVTIKRCRCKPCRKSDFILIASARLLALRVNYSNLYFLSFYLPKGLIVQNVNYCGEGSWGGPNEIQASPQLKNESHFKNMFIRWMSGI